MEKRRATAFDPKRRAVVPLICAPIEARLFTLADGLLSRVLRLGLRRLFARPGCLVVDRDNRAFGGCASLPFNRSAKCNCSQRC